MKDAKDAPKKTLRDLLLESPSAVDTALEPVSLPEWNIPDGTCFVRTMSGTERDAWEMDQLTRREEGGMASALENVRARLACVCLCDSKGAQILRVDDAAAMGAKAAKPLARIFEKASALNGLSAEDVEELAKNSNSDSSDDSGLN